MFLTLFKLRKFDEFSKTLHYLKISSDVLILVGRNKNFIRRKLGEDVKGWPGVKKYFTLGEYISYILKRRMLQFLSSSSQH